MQGANAVLNVITIPPGASKTSPRLVLDGIRGAIFVYQSGGPLGALIGSWAGTAGTDPYGNVYPAGINVVVGAISGTVFTGVDFILNSSGLFFYSGTPALGNLLMSLAPASGSDSFGNSFPAGVATTAFTLTGTNTILNTTGLFIYDAIVTTKLDAVIAGSVGTDSFGNQFEVGYVGTVKNWVAGNSGTIEAWNNVTPPSGWSGRNRYKNIAEHNCVLIDVVLTNGAGGSGNFSVMTLPVAYSPASGASFGIWFTCSPATTITTQRVTVTTGGVVTFANLPATTTNFGSTFILPLD